MKLAILALAFLVGCASAPPKMTDAERSAKATVVFSTGEQDPVSVVSDFLLSAGYSVDRYEERTQLLSTNWRRQDTNFLQKDIVGEMEKKVQVKIAGAQPEDAHTEFWIFLRSKAAQEDLLLQASVYDDLMGRFRTYLSGRGLTVR